MKAHDKLGRRLRTVRIVNRDETICPTARDVEALVLPLHLHGPLSSHTLIAFSAQWYRENGRNVGSKHDDNARDRLTRLFTIDTDYGGPVLGRFKYDVVGVAPWEAAICQLEPAGIELLKDKELWSAYAPKIGGPKKHQHMAASLTSSIELACHQTPGYRYLHHDEILYEAGLEELSFPITIDDPKTGKLLGYIGLTGCDLKRPKEFRF